MYKVSAAACCAFPQGAAIRQPMHFPASEMSEKSADAAP